jgi:GTP cyclohydrolase II
MNQNETLLNSPRSLDKAIVRMRHLASVYEEICTFSHKRPEVVVALNNTPFFEKAIEYFGPCLSPEKAKVDLKTVYDLAFHPKSGSLIVANKGVTIPALSPITGISYITRHIACSIYHPQLGLESVNIGLIGNVYEGNVILRAESACPPAFLFGSQRCNCCYQWASIRELAAHFNKVELPQNLTGDECEKWVEKQFVYRDGKHLSTRPGRGLILMHIDSQSGMGSGASSGEFAFDLYNRALMRQLGENTTEQVHHTSIKDGYEAIGVMPDARRQFDEAGYQIPAIVLSWLGVSKHLIVLSNNKFKIKQLEKHGFQVTRVKSLGKINNAGQREAKQRGEDFQHLDMDGEELSFDEEIQRLKLELTH